MSNVKEKTKHKTTIWSQCGEITVVNSTKNNPDIFCRHFAQLQIDNDGNDYISLTDEVIEDLIEALQNAKTNYEI